MSSYKYDLHVHTAELSPCGQVEIEKMMKMYKKEDYQGVVLTDHFRTRFFEDFNSWENGIDNLLSVFERAQQRGNKYNLDVILGLEACFEENNGDFLIFGVDEKFLKKYKNFIDGSLQEFSKIIDNKNILIFEAHPFRNKKDSAQPDFLDGLEVYNGNPRHDSRNSLAYVKAENNDLMMVSGSDFHQPEDLGKGGIILPQKISNSKQLVKQLKKGEFNLIGEELPFAV